jgi:hypothetical protein
MVSATSAAADPVIDPHSCAQPGQVRVTHLDLELTLDFAQRRLAGHATLRLEWPDPAATALLVDTRDLDIERVETLAPDGQTQALAWSLGQSDEILGCAQECGSVAGLVCAGIMASVVIDRAVDGSPLHTCQYTDQPRPAPGSYAQPRSSAAVKSPGAGPPAASIACSRRRRPGSFCRPKRRVMKRRIEPVS